MEQLRMSTNEQTLSPAQFSREWWENQQGSLDQQIGRAAIELEAAKEKLAKLQGARQLVATILNNLKT
jgi:hypothetical protein